MKNVLMGLVLAIGTAGAAAAAPVYPVSVVSANQPGTVAANRSDPTVLFDAYTDGDQFYSLGLGGDLVLMFSEVVSGLGEIVEVTFKIGGYFESVDIFVSTSETFADPAVASISNQNAQDGISFLVSEAFQYIKLVDTSDVRLGRDGFDVAEISFTAVPVPAAGLLLGGALFGFGALRRRAKKA